MGARRTSCHRCACMPDTNNVMVVVYHVRTYVLVWLFTLLCLVARARYLAVEWNIEFTALDAPWSTSHGACSVLACTSHRLSFCASSQCGLHQAPRLLLILCVAVLAYVAVLLLLLISLSQDRTWRQQLAKMG